MREEAAKSDDIALKQEMDKMKTKNIQLEQDLSKATTKINEAATEIMDLKQRLQRAEDKAYQELGDCLAQFVGGMKPSELAGSKHPREDVTESELHTPQVA